MRVFLVPGLMAVAAVVVGGVPGFLIGFTAAVLAVDRALDWRDLGAEQAFRRAARGRSGVIVHLPDDTGWAAVARRRRLGVEPILVSSIVGTTDAHKAEVFDASFRPPEFCRARWIQLWLVARRGGSMPPIAVYRVGDRHYVRDGHHRVSVLRALGADSVEADVVELVGQPSWRMVSVAHSTAS